MMNEEHFRNLIQKSTITASEDFTDKLLQKIEAQEAPQPLAGVIHSLLYPMLVVVGCGIVFIAIWLSGFLTELSLFGDLVRINKTPTLVILLSLVFLAANHLLRLQFYGKNLSRGS
jgi:hypothetical protein